LAIEMLVYGITGHKTVLFSVALIIPILLLLSTRARLFGLSFPVGAAALMVAAAAWDRLTESTLATALFVVRLIATPGLLTAAYYEFFSENVTYGLSHSILGFLGPMPYDVGPALLIGAVYFGNPATWANANLWADGFMNFGIIGILASTLILGAYLVVLDAAASRRDLGVTGALAGMMAITLSNAGVLTALMSHGLALSLILILLMPRQVETRVSADVKPRPRTASCDRPLRHTIRERWSLPSVTPVIRGARGLSVGARRHWRSITGGWRNRRNFAGGDDGLGMAHTRRDPDLQ